LARQLGRIVDTVHSCPVPEGAGLPVFDLCSWPLLVERNLFAGDELHGALTRLAPDLEPAVRRGIAAASAIDGLGQTALTWRDASLHNTVADIDDDGNAAVCGVFDFQGARLSQPYLDLRMPYERLTGRPWTEEDMPAEEWLAFVEGYGGRVDLTGPARDASACANPAWQVRHWWDILGHLHRRTPSWIDELLAGLARLQP
jgi:Ser/Thr protein kinase RdoA (MazF antagonist)